MKTKFIACATALLIATGAVASAQDLPVFGDIYLSKTPMKQIGDNLRAKGCAMELKDSTYNGQVVGVQLEIGPTCLGFPSSYTVALLPDTENTMGAAIVVFPKSFEDTEFKRIYSGLKEKYGKPAIEKLPFVGNKYVRWNKPSLVIELKEDHMSNIGTLSYMRPELKQKSEENLRKAEKDDSRRMNNSL